MKILTNDDYKIKQVNLVKGYHACIKQHEFSKNNRLDFRYACVLKENADTMYPRDLICDLIHCVEECFQCDNIVVEEKWSEFRKVFRNPDSKLEKLFNLILRSVLGLWGLKACFFRESFSSITEYKKYQIKSGLYEPFNSINSSFSVIFNKNHNVIAFFDEEYWYDFESMVPYTDSCTLAVYTANDISVELTKAFRGVCKKYGIDNVSFIEGTSIPVKGH